MELSSGPAGCRKLLPGLCGRDFYADGGGHVVRVSDADLVSAVLAGDARGGCAGFVVDDLDVPRVEVRAVAAFDDRFLGAPQAAEREPGIGAAQAVGDFAGGEIFLAEGIGPRVASPRQVFHELNIEADGHVRGMSVPVRGR